MKNFFKKLAFIMALVMVISMTTPMVQSLFAGMEFTYAEQESNRRVTCVSLEKGEKVGLTVVGIKDYGNYVPKWVSSNPAVAVVDDRGIITAVGDGVATVELKLGDSTDYTSVPVVVSVGKVAEVIIGISKNETFAAYTLEIGKTVDFNFYGVTDWAADKYICTWVSSDNTVAIVDKNGIVTPVAAGMTEITVVIISKATGAAWKVIPVVVTVRETGGTDLSMESALVPEPAPQLPSASIPSTNTTPFQYVVKEDGTIKVVRLEDVFLEEAEVPNLIEGKAVTEIGDAAFSECSSLTSIILPEGITKIGANAFDGCSNLTNVVLPDSLREIGAYAFSNCSSLTLLTLPEGVVTLYEGLISGCSSLILLTLPESLKNILGTDLGFSNNLQVVYVAEDSFAEHYVSRKQYQYQYTIVSVADSTAEPTQIPRPTSTPKPTLTPEPTLMPGATSVPEPTLTPEPTPTPQPTPAVTQVTFTGNISSLLEAQIGDTVRFGSYEQDNDMENGAEEIEWYVLDKQDGKLFLFSKYVLDVKPYYEKKGVIGVDAIWEKCTLRKWLNEEFYHTAFSEEEQGQIAMTRVKNDGSPALPINRNHASNDTDDKVFLLSFEEIERYFISGYVSWRSLEWNYIVPGLRTERTEYAKAKSAAEAAKAYFFSGTETGAKSGWWLRSPGSATFSCAAYVDTSNGRVWVGGSSAQYSYNSTADFCYCVRPALWIELEPETQELQILGDGENFTD